MRAGWIPGARLDSWSQDSFLEPGFIPGGFSPRFPFLAWCEYSVTASWCWQCPNIQVPPHPTLAFPRLIPTHRSPQQGFPFCHSPTKGLDILIFGGFGSIYHSKQTPQASLLMISITCPFSTHLRMRDGNKAKCGCRRRTLD